MADSNRHFITGNTYPVKDQLRDLGCRWDGSRKAWYTEDAEIAAKAAAIVGPTPLYNSPPPQDLGTTDAAALAAKYGRTAVEGAKVQSFTGHGKDPEKDGRIVLFTGKRLGGKRFIQVAHGKPIYFSRDMMFNGDDFDDEPGWQYQWDGVEVEPAAEEASEDQIKATAKARAEQEAAEAKARQQAEAEARAKVWDETIAGLDCCTCCPEGAVETDDRLDYPDARASAVKLLLSDGSIGWRRSWSGFDDSRTYYFLPPIHAAAARLRWAFEAGITPESAAEWLARYKDCEGTDVRQAVCDADEETKDRLRTAAAEKKAKKRAADIANERASIRRSAERELKAFQVLDIVIPEESIEHFVDHNTAVRATGAYHPRDLIQIEGVVIKVKASAPPPAPKRGKKAVAPSEVKLHNFCTARIIQED